MNEQLTIFTLGDRRYGLRLAAVDRVVRAVAISPHTARLMVGLVVDAYIHALDRFLSLEEEALAQTMEAA